MKKKIISTILSTMILVTAFAFVTNATDESAKTTVYAVTENSAYLNSEPRRRDNSRPDTAWNLSTKGQYNYSGSASITYLFTLYYFTNASHVEIRCKNNSSSDPAYAELRKRSSLGYLFDTTVSEQIVPVGQTYTWGVDVNSGSGYYLRFSVPCNVQGYIKKLA